MDQEKIKEVYKGKVITLKVVEGDYMGKHIRKEIVVHPDVVAVLPLTDDNKIILVKQYRVPVKKELWEIPTGKIDKEEAPFNCALRELEEETGFKAKELKEMNGFYNSPGYSTVYMYVFKATGLTKGSQKLSDNEIINKVQAFSLKQALEMIDSKEIINAYTIVGIMYLLNELK